MQAEQLCLPPSLGTFGKTAMSPALILTGSPPSGVTVTSPWRKGCEYSLSLTLWCLHVHVRVECGRKANIDLQHEARLGIRVRPAHTCARIVGQNKVTRQCVAARDHVRTRETWTLHSPMLASSRPRPFLCPRVSSPGSARPGKRVGWAASARRESSAEREHETRERGMQCHDHITL